MKINCDWEECTLKCKYYHVCSLRKTYSPQLSQLAKEREWQITQLKQLNGGIEEYMNTIREYDSLPEVIKKRISLKELHEILNQMRADKKEILLEIKRIRVKESNIMKILNRRERKCLE